MKAAGRLAKVTCWDPLLSRRTRWLSTDQVPSGMLPMASPSSGNDASDALRSKPPLSHPPLHIAQSCTGSWLAEHI